MHFLPILQMKNGLRKAECLSQWQGKNCDACLSNSRNLKCVFQPTELKSNYRERLAKVDVAET